jgi:predicted MPP superfamily phosphohydrolase
MNSFLLFRLLATLGFVAVTGGVAAGLIRRAWPDAWRRWAKRAFVAGAVLAAVSTLAWAAARHLQISWLHDGALVISATALVTCVSLFVSSPVWGTAAWGARRLQRSAPDPSRRAFLGQAAGTLPVAAAAAGPVGATAALMTPTLRRVDVPVADLPAGLEGLRILQLTDIHLGNFIDVDQVLSVVEAARSERPDLVLLTGDIADDYDKLPPALEAVASLEPRLGAFAVYGNHEVYRGRERAARIYGESDVRLLCEEGVVLERGGDRLWLGGCDDPATLGREHRDFLQSTVRKTVETCPDDVPTRVLMSHRPEGFEEATRAGVTLTLAGHTHGAQMAFLGRSLLEPFLPKSYLLGPYTAGDSHLYTSAGLGHWFPFRLNCPCEAALITLRRGDGPARVL